jgi:PadR family transcriptional regulator, regulatory protein PadR
MSDVEIRPRNSLVPVALMTLQEESARGYELMKRLAELGFEEKIPGTLYRTLGQMEQEGLCKTEWETSNEGGRGCRVYSITNEGEAYLDSWAELGGKQYFTFSHCRRTKNGGRL